MILTILKVKTRLILGQAGNKIQATLLFKKVQGLWKIQLIT